MLYTVQNERLTMKDVWMQAKSRKNFPVNLINIHCYYTIN
jgi:hypothetical protein